MLGALPARAGEPLRLPGGGRLGTPAILRPADAPQAVIYLFSGLDGWTRVMQETAEALVDEGAVVVPIDSSLYRRALDADAGECLYLIGEIENSSRILEEKLGITTYLSPILAGTGFGSGVAYAALAQAPAATIAGALSDGLVTEVTTRIPLCAGAAATGDATRGYTYAPVARLPGFWRIGVRPHRRDFDRSAPYAAANDKTVRVLLADAPLADRMRELFTQALAENMETVADSLPLVELESAGPAAGDDGDLLAVIYSGDGGWRDLDKQIGEYLAGHGVATVGVDSLRYFWTERSPKSMAADLEDIVRTYGDRWNRKRLLLIGYSFGADMLPFIVGRLSPETRARIARIGLLGLAEAAATTVGIGEWLGVADPDELHPVAPEIARLDGLDVLCVMGKEETASGCRNPVFDRFTRYVTEGGHHFDGGYEAIADRLLSGIRPSP
ncbi:MAG: virulence factor family protein [Geminicoccaceae bacterium]|nr:virulence factor family protein [Geminicoccaceae bacterium]